MNKTTWQRLLSSAFFSMALCAVYAEAPPSLDKVTATIKEKLKTAFPNHPPITHVRQSVIPGVYEVVLGKNTVLYFSADGQYVLTGHIFNSKTKEDLTQKQIFELSKLNFVKEVKPHLKNAIKDVRGKGKRTLVVFSDPDCFYCQALEKEALKEIDNVTIYTFLYPRPEAHEKARLIWCAPNRVDAWHKWMRSKALPKPTKPACSASSLIAENKKFAETLGVVNGTPTLIFETGQVRPGSMSRDKIEKLLNERPVVSTLRQ